MKRSSVVVTGLALLLLCITVVLSNCGGGGGGGSQPLQPPAYNLSGNWQETQTLSQQNGCGATGPNYVQWSMSQQSGSNTVTITIQSGSVSATMSGNNLTYSGPLDVGDPNVSCNQSLVVTFTSSTHGSGSNTAKCTYTGGSCTTIFNEVLDRI